MIKKGSLVRVKRSGDHYGIREDWYETAHNLGPVRVRRRSSTSASLDFDDDTVGNKVSPSVKNTLSAYLWPLDRLEECEDEERIVDPDRDALFSMIGL